MKPYIIKFNFKNSLPKQVRVKARNLWECINITERVGYKMFSKKQLDNCIDTEYYEDKPIK